MSPHLCRNISAALLTLIVSRIYAAEPIDLTFREALNRVAEARSRIKSYELNVIGVVDYKAKEVKLTDGSTYVVDRKPVSFLLQMVFDRDADRLLVAREDSYVMVASNERVTEDWKLFASTPQWDLIGGTIRTHEARNRSHRPTYFDPLAFGLLLGEFRTGAPLTKLITDISANADSFSVTRIENGNVQFELRDQPQRSIEFDTQHDYWPIAATGRDIKSTLKLARIHDQWLPATGSIDFRDEQIDLKFDWLAVNKPVNPRFAKQDIEQRYRIAISDQRQ